MKESGAEHADGDALKVSLGPEKPCDAYTQNNG